MLKDVPWISTSFSERKNANNDFMIENDKPVLCVVGNDGKTVLSSTGLDDVKDG